MRTLFHLIFVLFNPYLIGPTSAYLCCDALNSKTLLSTDYKCSDQTGGVGTCICTTLPNTRSTWLCKKDANGDSVNNICFINIK